MSLHITSRSQLGCGRSRIGVRAVVVGVGIRDSVAFGREPANLAPCLRHQRNGEHSARQLGGAAIFGRFLAVTGQCGRNNRQPPHSHRAEDKPVKN